MLKATNIDLTPSIKDFVEEKIGSVSKFIGLKDAELAEARVEIGRPSRHHKSGPIYRAELNLKIGKALFRAVVEHADLRTAVDFVRDEVERQIKKDKQKHRDSRRMPTKI